MQGSGYCTRACAGVNRISISNFLLAGAGFFRGTVSQPRTGYNTNHPLLWGLLLRCPWCFAPLRSLSNPGDAMGVLAYLQRELCGCDSVARVS